MEQEIKRCVEKLLNGDLILYPTDTIWGIGCDATNEKTIERIYNVKQRHERKSMLILLDKPDKIPLYVKKIPLIAWDLILQADRPTTFIYPTAYNLPAKIIPSDGTIAIRITKNTFCKKLIQTLDRPLISTSANVSGTDAPNTFKEISNEIISQMDYVVPEEYADSTDYKPSRMIRFLDDYNFMIIRK